MASPFAGVDLGGTNMQIGIVRVEGDWPDAQAEFLAQDKKKTKSEQGLEAVLDRIVEGVREACADASIEMSDLGGVGIGAPGMLDPETGHIYLAPNLDWRDVPVGQLLSERFGLPVAIENDVNAAILGEASLGAARGSRDVMGVWVGTGVGGGLILDGKLRSGHFASCGEIGHMQLFPLNPPGLRSVEHNCSRTAVVHRITGLIRAGHRSAITDLVEGKLDKIKSGTVASAYAARDPLVVEVVDHSAELLGIHIGSVHTLLSLERVVLGGGLTEALGEPYVRIVEHHAKRCTFPDLAKSIQIVATELEDRAGVLGAVMHAHGRAGTHQD